MKIDKYTSGMKSISIWLQNINFYSTDIVFENQDTTGYLWLFLSISGTGRAHRVERPELSGSVPPGIRWPDQLSLWRCWPLERRTRWTSGRWDTWNFRLIFDRGAAWNRRSIRELWSHSRTGVRLEIWGNRKPLLGWDRFLCFSRYSGCWWSPPGEPRSSLPHPGQVTCQIPRNSLS